MNLEQARIHADILKALAHPIRILLVDALRDGDRCVCELNRLAAVHQSNISRHLAILKKAGIVSERKEGQRVIHHLSCPCMLQAVACAMEVLQSEAKQRRRVLKGA